MANGIRTGDPGRFNKGLSLKYREGSRVRQAPVDGRRIYRPKRCGNNNKDEDNNLYDEKNVCFFFLFIFSEIFSMNINFALFKIGFWQKLFYFFKDICLQYV